MPYIKIYVPDDFDQENDTWKLVGGPGTHDLQIWTPEYRNVLDHGYVGLVDFMGDDMAAVHAARTSYGKGTKKMRSDEGLIRYLMRHRHTTPFEMTTFKWHVKAPIFVFRQWHRHRTASINEYSGRYSIIEDDMYVPDIQNLKPQSQSNRQGRSDEDLTIEEYQAVMAAVDHVYDLTYETYQYILPKEEGEEDRVPPEPINRRKLWLEECAVKAVTKARKEARESGRDDPYPNESDLEAVIAEYYAANDFQVLDNDFPGVAKELARMVLPVATYSQMYWCSNLHNIFHFLSLRCDPHAQYEIRVYADEMLDMMEPYVPWATKAFEDYVLNGSSLSRAELEAIKGLAAKVIDQASLLSEFTKEHEEGQLVEYITSMMKKADASPREIREFLQKVI